MKRAWLRCGAVMVVAVLFCVMSPLLVASAAFTPTPEVPSREIPYPPPVQPPPQSPASALGSGENCTHRFEINLVGCVPPGFVVSGWSDGDPKNYTAPTGSQRFDIPWTQQIIGVGFDAGTQYYLWGWSPSTSWVRLGEPRSEQCGNYPLAYALACPATPTPTATAAPTPTATPQPELPKTGGGAGRTWGVWLLAGIVATFAIWRARRLIGWRR